MGRARARGGSGTGSKSRSRRSRSSAKRSCVVVSFSSWATYILSGRTINELWPLLVYVDKMAFLWYLHLNQKGSE